MGPKAGRKKFTPVFASRKIASLLCLAGTLVATSFARPASDLSLPVTGDLFGTVVDSAGVPQMGASVEILNKYRRFIARTVTNAQGRFAVSGLSADLYSVQVSLASFLPAARDRIEVKPGANSVLEIHLATLLSNIEVNYRVPTSAMSDDWKWVLRASPATRPVNRFIPVDFPNATQNQVRPRLFTGTHAMVSVSGGDGGLVDSTDSALELGTSFALSTNILGRNQVQLAGTLGQANDFGPAALALCAIYSRTPDPAFGDTLLTGAPEVTVTMAQIGGLSSQLSNNNPGTPNLNPGGIPVLRTMSLSMYQTADPVGNVHLEYGMTGEAVEFVQHASRISPFARATIDLGAVGQFVLAYSDGGRPDELTAHQQSQGTALDTPADDLTAPIQNLARLPQVSNSNGRLELQRTQNYEIGFRKSVGFRTYAVSGFSEHVSNGRLNVAGDESALPAGDLFSDGVSTTAAYNIGRYDRLGYLASVNQRVNDRFDLALAYGRLGGFAANGNSPFSATPNSSSTFLNEGMHNLASLSVKAVVPRMGTHFVADYGWVDPHAVLPRHALTTQDVFATPGFNVLIRQPLPSFGLPGHLELTADLRNLLAEGYSPLATSDGRQLLVVEAPRAIRGGVKFTF